VKKFLSFFLTFAIGAFIGSFAGIPLQAGVAFVGMKAASATFGVMPGVAYSAVDVSALAAYPGEYEQQLFSTLINSLDIAQDIMVMPNVKNKVNMTKLTVGNGARPYSATHEPGAGDLDYTPRVLSVSVGKRDLLIEPEAFRATFMAKMVGPGSGASKMDIPFAQYVWTEVMKSLARELNDEVAFFGLDSSDITITAFATGGSGYAVGDYVTFGTAPKRWYKCIATAADTESPATHPAKWQDVTARVITRGLGTLIVDEIADSNLAATATGVVNSGATALAAFKKLFRAHSDAYKKAGLITFCSYTDYEYLLDGLTETTKYTKEDASAGFVYLPETGKKNIIKPATWMNGSRRLICTPAENLILGTDLLSDLNDISVIPDVYTLKTGIKFVLGFQIRDLSAIKVGDQA
jgi:hypothetical protein